MIPAASPVGTAPARRISSSRILWFAAVVFLGVLPVLTVLVLFVAAIQDDTVAVDFRQFYGAAANIVHGHDPYAPPGDSLTEWGGPYPYPPLPAELALPWTLFSLATAEILVMGSLVLAALAVPFVLGVRDWRCYGVIFLWPPVLSAIQTGNVTLWFALAAALVWRFRDRMLAASVSLGLTLAAKFFLWPVAVWLAATRRSLTAVLSVAVGLALLLVSWGAIGFAGFTTYPDIVRKLEKTVGEDSYTLYIVGLDLGLPSAAARAVWLAFGCALVLAVVAVGRRGNERAAFLLSIAAALALTPIVWLHYFALLVVVVAVARPVLGVDWFVPLGMVLTPGSGHPTPLETAWTLAVAACTFALALRASRRAEPTVESQSRTSDEPLVGRATVVDA